MNVGIDWYPKRLSELDSWHSNFATQAGLTGTTLGLSAAFVTQIGVDASFVAILINFDLEIRAYSQAWTDYRNSVLRGNPNAPLPVFPNLPAVVAVPIGGLPGIEARTRVYANIIRANPNYTEATGELYGLVAVTPTGPTTPSLNPTAVVGTSNVSVKINKGGYSAVAIDMKRGGGTWTQVGISLTATFIDTTPPLVPGQPELRDYRGQGMDGNDRVGEVSPVVSLVTIP